VPKIVDHDERRDELAEAFWRVLARDGLQGATTRAVCAEAGRSRDAVDHYFAGKDELVSFAVGLAVRRALAQVRACCAEHQGREALRAVLLEGLALEQSGPAPASAWLELLPLAARDPALAAELARFDQDVRAELAELIGEMVARGEAAPGTDPEAEARDLFAFNLSLRSRVRLQPGEHPDEAVAREVDAYLDRLARGARSDA
jgi:AcrR family transcriptional regulator